MPLQSQIINVLPRRLLASLWASQETRLSVHKILAACALHPQQQQPSVTTQSFLCDELPIRYSHMLRLLSTLSPDQLQTPMIRHVAHRYLHDMCTLLHPSLRSTSDRAFNDLIRKLRQRQAASLIRMRYALVHTKNNALMEHINTVGLGIQFLTATATATAAAAAEGRVQTVKPAEIAMQAVQDARQVCASCLGRDAPTISIQEQPNLSLTFMPHVLHRMLFESTMITLRARMLQQQYEQQQHHSSNSPWKALFDRAFQRRNNSPLDSIQLDIFGGPTSIGFRLQSPAPLLPSDLKHDIPRDPLGIPSCPSVLSRTESTTLRDDLDMLEDAEWHVWSGWRAAKTMASHWGGNLDVVSMDGLGSTMYLALDRDTSLLERYPSRPAAAIASTAAPLTLAAAEDQLNAFLGAIADPSHQPAFIPARKDEIYHSVSLSAAVAAAVGHA
ncbi:hypothetical protein BDB00DRAFT_965588 [Zychaea mexicana]|uniref:uncharacterized protein n=1 Tax=Zychaea mexicana TaxID=64656 RepID=UPI0022FE7F97|nr:uncharacterized protein BDB00DRAFT_965588 [Zychaea mexicana]KAI9482634.1 hypothetical protein BDB00DRAFT_965588 [Zychaea mexicana]